MEVSVHCKEPNELGTKRSPLPPPSHSENVDVSGRQGVGGTIPIDSFFSSDCGLRSLDSPGLSKNCHFTRNYDTQSC